MSTQKLPKPRHILELSPEEKVKFINSFDLVFSDIDGVLWNLHKDVEGAAEGFQGLTKAGKKLLFVTNNSVRSENALEHRLKDHGINVKNTDIIHPADNVVKYLLSKNFDGLIYCIGSVYFKTIIRKAGFKIIDGPNKIFEESFSDFGRQIFDKEPVRAVVIDADFNLSGAKMMRAHWYLKHPDCILIIGATDSMLPLSKEIQILGPGPYGKILAEASGKTPILMGKPGKELADMLVDRFDIKDRSRALMIGDMLEQDIGFGKLIGMQTLLVLSGGCNKTQMLENRISGQHPDYYADTMYDFVEFFESSKL
ncbi:chronophin isoform X2 [Eupeodes corollae]|uniref:chronophin isoform X2 n=1 Tax=Eupeodes corollae TaxID=290404 RepID=UPI00249291FE|nr:chronophin isoform X2 [Eupeodes corollae]